MANMWDCKKGGFSQYPAQKNGLDLNTVLDLSRKKDVTDVFDETKEKINLTTKSQTLSTNVNNKYEQLNLPESNEPMDKWSIAGSSAMLSPYSESNSPKRMRTESMGYYEDGQLKRNATLNMSNITNALIATHQNPSSSFTLPEIPNEITKISVATSTMPVLRTKSRSFVPYNEAEERFSWTMPTEKRECSPSTNVELTSSVNTATLKTQRPFKAYPKNFLSIASHLDCDSNEDYALFRAKMLETIKKGNMSNPKMRRVSKSPGSPTSTIDDKDKAAYREKRRKNNEAAKRSREARRAKEDELAIRTAYLEHANVQLRTELKDLQHSYNELLCQIHLMR